MLDIIRLISIVTLLYSSVQHIFISCNLSPIESFGVGYSDICRKKLDAAITQIFTTARIHTLNRVLRKADVEKDSECYGYLLAEFNWRLSEMTQKPGYCSKFSFRDIEAFKNKYQYFQHISDVGQLNNGNENLQLVICAHWQMANRPEVIDVVMPQMSAVTDLIDGAVVKHDNRITYSDLSTEIRYMCNQLEEVILNTKIKPYIDADEPMPEFCSNVKESVMKELAAKIHQLSPEDKTPLRDLLCAVWYYHMYH